MVADAVVRAGRRAAATLKYLPDRLMHPLRRQYALEQLGRSGTPDSVIFICHGNICRSPYAAYAFTRALPEVLRPRVHVSSAGFVGPGRPPPENAILVAEERGIDLREHRSRLITLEDIETRHLIVVMDTMQRDRIAHGVSEDRQHLILLGDLDPAPIRTRRIHDPILGEPDVFRTVYARIDRCVGELARAVGGVLLPGAVAGE